jgi:leader peptidase (prepilin peptidase) / N-methyltransferase
VNLILSTPLEVRLAAIFVIGAFLGGFANLGIYRLSFFARPISPWSKPAPSAAPRRWHDRLPIIGWLALRREASLHGRGFWIRPMLIELVCAAGFAALYWWEMTRRGLLSPDIRSVLIADWLIILHGMFVGQLALIWLMIVASFIDVDERIIPDTITVPGTLIGLTLAAIFGGCALPVVSHTVGGVMGIQLWLEYMWLTAPIDPPAVCEGCPNALSLLIGLACFWLWCVALMPRTWYSRHGWRRAMQLCWARLIRERFTLWVLIVGAVGAAAIIALWFIGGMNWLGLLSSLVSMAVAGGLVWTIRIIGSAVLKREAMGFGDVTLLAMIGAFLGWQAALIIFFMAPLAGLVVGLLRLIISRDHEIPYGPFLCLAAATAIVTWGRLWDWASEIFALLLENAWIMPLLALGCVAILSGLLLLMRGLRGVLDRRG